MHGITTNGAYVHVVSFVFHFNGETFVACHMPQQFKKNLRIMRTNFTF